MGSRMLSEGGLLIKEKLDLAFEDEIEDVTERENIVLQLSVGVLFTLHR